MFRTNLVESASMFRGGPVYLGACPLVSFDIIDRSNGTRIGLKLESARRYSRFYLSHFTIASIVSVVLGLFVLRLVTKRSRAFEPLARVSARRQAGEGRQAAGRASGQSPGVSECGCGPRRHRFEPRTVLTRQPLDRRQALLFDCSVIPPIHDISTTLKSTKVSVNF